MATTRIVTERSGALASPRAEATKLISCTPACFAVGDHVKRADAGTPGRLRTFAPAGSPDAAAISIGTAFPGSVAAREKLTFEPAATL